MAPSSAQRKFVKQSKPPTASQWKKMKIVDKVRVQRGDSPHLQETFTIGLNVAIIPAEGSQGGFQANGMLQEQAYWYGQIVEMRKKEGLSQGEVWARVMWFWRKANFREKSSGLKLTDEQYEALNLDKLGIDEVVKGDMCDYIDVETFESPITVLHFDERIIKQGWFPKNTLYWRYTFNAKTLSIEGRSTFCVCQSFYCPDEGIQRWCLECEDWFHISCLCQNEPGETITGSETGVNEILRKVAASPIERGGDTGPAGHAKAVLNARKMIRKHNWAESDLDTYIGKQALCTIPTESPVYYHCPICDKIL